MFQVFLLFIKPFYSLFTNFPVFETSNILPTNLACLQSLRRRGTFNNSACFGFTKAVSILCFTACLQFATASTVHLYFLEEACQWKIQSPKKMCICLRSAHVHVVIIFTIRVVFSVFPIFQVTLQLASAKGCVQSLVSTQKSPVTEKYRVPRCLKQPHLHHMQWTIVNVKMIPVPMKSHQTPREQDLQPSQTQVIPNMFMPYIEGPKMDWTVNDGLYHRFLKWHLKMWKYSWRWACNVFWEKKIQKGNCLDWWFGMDQCVSWSLSTEELTLDTIWEMF